MAGKWTASGSPLQYCADSVHPYSAAQIPVHPYSAAQIPVHPYSAAQIWLPASTSACACEEEGTQLNSAAGGGTPCDVLFLLG